MILVFGSLNADFFLPLQNFPAPGETLLTPEAFVKPGGKGANQAAAAAKAGGLVKMAGAVGRDEVAKVPVTALKALGVDCTYMQTSDHLATGMAMIMVDAAGENSIVVASGSNGALSAGNVPDSLLTPETTLVLQMEVPPEETFKLMRRAKDRGVRTVLNVAPARPVPAEALAMADYLILNEIEAETIYKSLFEGHSESVEKKAQAMAEKTGGICLVTMGKNGVIAAGKGKMFKAGSLNIRPVDTTGAGDAFVGIFAAMIDSGLTLEDAVKTASAGAGLACMKIGAQEALPTLKEIEERVDEIKVS